MARTQTAGRNDLCPCGSKMKMKKCCGAKAPSSWGSKAMMVAVLGIVAGAIAVMIASYGETSSATGVPGQVWSQEHGHYH